MLPTGFFAVLISIGFLALITLVSMRGGPHRKRRARDGGPILPIWTSNEDDSGDGGS